ncbi:MAG TPA: C45 family peptidase, partial [Thermoplasmata archaeon]|nr:C45 family peptidase [Thermoplasmata archaeon]
LAFTEAGIAGAKIGLNSAGVGLAINGLVSNLDSWSRLRKPFHVRCWEILAAATLGNAELAVTSAKRSCSTNFLIAQAGENGHVVDLEAAPDNERRLEPADGFLAHTNHFSDPDGLGIWQPLAEDRQSTFDRYTRANAVLGSWADGGRKVTVEDLKRMLRDHTGAPRSLCRHQDRTLPPESRYETVVSVIMDLDAKEMYVASGTPCTARYRRIALQAAAGSRST